MPCTQPATVLLHTAQPTLQRFLDSSERELQVYASPSRLIKWAENKSLHVLQCLL